MALRRYSVNHNYFSELNSDMAYILGFWWADGWIYCKNNAREFCISQKKSRKYILKKILVKMGSNHKIRENNSGCLYFKIYSSKICSDIIRLGGMQNKSLRIGLPKIPRRYLSDFIRGYFDGDGCICCYKRKTGEKQEYCITFTSGSKKLIYGLLDVLRANISGFGGRIQIKNEKTKTINGTIWKHNANTYVLWAAVNDVRRLKEFMYNESKLMLLEKYKKFQKIGEISGEYLKTKFLSFNKCKAIARRNNIRSGIKWKTYARKHKMVPCNPQKVYRNTGWSGWNDFLGI